MVVGIGIVAVGSCAEIVHAMGENSFAEIRRWDLHSIASQAMRAFPPNRIDGRPAQIIRHF